MQGEETGAERAGREAHGGRAAHLDDVENQQEEVDPPSGGDSTRLGLEPRSHRQQLPLASSGSSTCLMKL